MKIIAGLKLHPRGFLGAPLEYHSPHAKRPIQVDLIGTATRKIVLENEDNSLTPNVFVEDLYEKILADEKFFKNPEFLERLYLAALRAFGTDTINEWFIKQKQNPYFDTMQNRFVEETVGYVFTGNRKYHPQVYLDTLDMGTQNAFEIGPNTRAGLLNGYQGRPVLLRDFIGRWLSQRDGLSDLAISLRILFGS